MCINRQLNNRISYAVKRVNLFSFNTRYILIIIYYILYIDLIGLLYIYYIGLGLIRN